VSTATAATAAAAATTTTESEKKEEEEASTQHCKRLVSNNDNVCKSKEGQLVPIRAN
jgi:hypothetical protein